MDDYVKVRRWRRAGQPAILVEVASVRGSTPRGTDALMAVTREDFAGTIGGGRLEWIALEEARRRLGERDAGAPLDIALGPQIGQCCGGRATLAFRLVDDAVLDELEEKARRHAEARPQVLVFGAGHTGKALARQLALLPYSVKLVDSRPEALAPQIAGVASLAAAMPEAQVRRAAPGSAFVAMTHSHDLDFLVTAEALARGDAAYAGMIGSATKRAVFLRWLGENGYDTTIGERLVCPIGGAEVRDKRPQIIAALTAAEIVTALAAAHPGSDSIR